MLTNKAIRAPQFSASIRIFGRELDFDSLSSVLGQPSHTHRSGEHGRTSKPFSQDLWSLDSPLARSASLDEHIRWLKKALEPHSSFLRQVMQKSEVRSFCGVIADGTECGFVLSGDASGLFTELGIGAEVSLIFLGSEDETSAGLSSTNQRGESANESGPEAYRTESRVYLDLSGAEPDRVAASDALGVRPSDFLPTSQDGVSGAQKTWSLLAPVNAEQEIISQGLLWLGALLSRRPDSVKSLRVRSQVVIRCEYCTESDHGDFEISTEALQVPVALDLPLEFHTQLI